MRPAEAFVDYDLPGRGTTRFEWEYKQDILESVTFADPPYSVPPLVLISRRLVSAWEPYEMDDDQVRPD